MAATPLEGMATRQGRDTGKGQRRMAPGNAGFNGLRKGGEAAVAAGEDDGPGRLVAAAKPEQGQHSASAARDKAPPAPFRRSPARGWHANRRPEGSRRSRPADGGGRPPATSELYRGHRTMTLQARQAGPRNRSERLRIPTGLLGNRLMVGQRTLTPPV